MKIEIKYKIELSKLITTNHLYITNGNKRFRTKDYINFEKLIKWSIVEQIGYEAIESFREDASGKTIGVSVVVRHSTKRRFDIDNIFKPLLDSMQGILYDDDRVICHIYGCKMLDQTIKGYILECKLFVIKGRK